MYLHAPGNKRVLIAGPSCFPSYCTSNMLPTYMSLVDKQRQASTDTISQSNPNPSSRQWLHTQAGVSQPMQPLAPVPRGMAFAFSLFLAPSQPTTSPIYVLSLPISEHISSIHPSVDKLHHQPQPNKIKPLQPFFLLGRRRQHIISMFIA